MKRTHNGILIPDVPIMAGGNLPNAVKGVSAGGGEKKTDYKHTHFFIKNNTQTAQDVLIRHDGGNVLSVETSFDEKSWNPFNILVRLEPNNTVYFRCETNSWANNYSRGNYFELGYSTSTDIGFEIGGNIMSLLYGKNFTGEENEFPDSSHSQFAHLFDGKKVKNLLLTDATNLILPTAISMGCYDSLFYFCGNLEGTPILPAEILMPSSYNSIFAECNKVNYVKLLANDLSADRCVFRMFLNVAPVGTLVKKRGVIIPSEAELPTGWTVEEID